MTQTSLQNVQLSRVTSSTSASASHPLSNAFLKELLGKYGALMIPQGAKVSISNVETYKVDRSTRIRGTVTVKTADFTAKLAAMAAVKKDGTVKADYFPSYDGAQCKAEDKNIFAAASYGVRIHRLDRAQLSTNKLKEMFAEVDPKTHKFSGIRTNVGRNDLAEITVSSAGFMGPGSRFEEYYRVSGTIENGQAKLGAEMGYDNKAFTADGQDLDGFNAQPD